MADAVLLLCGGRQAFYGSPVQLEQHLAALKGVPAKESIMSTAEYALNLITPAVMGTEEAVTAVVDQWSGSAAHAALQERLEAYRAREHTDVARLESQSVALFARRVGALIQRQVVNSYRDPAFVGYKLVLFMLLRCAPAARRTGTCSLLARSFIIATVFLYIPQTTDGVQGTARSPSTMCCSCSVQRWVARSSSA